MPRMPKPDFLIIGTQKAGTTWLARNLEKHPSVYCAPREIHFFDRNYHRGIDWYLDQFPTRSVDANLIIGEKTPDYLDGISAPVPRDRQSHYRIPDIASRVHALLPDTKIIISLRDPVTRSESAFNHFASSARINPLKSPEKVIFDSNVEQNLGILEKGYYINFLRKYLRFFEREKIFLINYDVDIKRNAAETLLKIFRFLNVSDFIPENINQKRNAYLGTPPAWVLKYYFPKYIPQISKLDQRLPGKRLRGIDHRIKFSSNLKKELKKIYKEPNHLLEKELNFDTRYWES